MKREDYWHADLNRDDPDGTEVLQCNREGWHEGSLRFSIK